MEEQNLFNNANSNIEAPVSQKEQLQQIVAAGAAESAPANSSQVKYAGFWIRFAANIIDGIIVTVLMILAIVVFSLINPILGAIMYILIAILAWVGLISMTKICQATPGKKVLGLIVTRSDFSQASWGRIILRETVGKMVSGMILYIGYIMAGFTDKKQALHDLIADTVVIYKN